MKVSRVVRFILAALLGYWLFTSSAVPVVIMWALMFINSELDRND